MFTNKYSVYPNIDQKTNDYCMYMYMYMHTFKSTLYQIKCNH